jgi:demethylmenaquinone methyltransferase/2-methoxy-6-polyprenyl-1,4-benzoquinol methylase
MAHLITEAGWRDVAWRNLSGGIVALHRATKAPAAIR